MRRFNSWALAAIATFTLGGCALEFQNAQPYQQVQREAQPPGQIYAGWRVFQDKCASCHGPAGLGAGDAPNLLPIVRELGPRSFVSRVLTRYEWSRPAPSAEQQGAALEAMIERIVQRQDAPLVMPAWEGNPRVNAHIMDLYAYLSARSEGREGNEAPKP